ncbi:uncharacterized protein PRCAT00004716001 [Priceomyces carsonii]|uniref:uncharacterized protein n=1 Tax=Priceomyces carsonii TaxID=28549 RepID=UPI002EDBB5C0|nr:unnamed protein product [Priceomyces carsonii]
MGNFPKLPEGTKLSVGTHHATILKYLSEGGFAHIYKVKIEPKVEDTDIACLKRVIVPDKNGLHQLRKEVDVMKMLRHGRNIVRYYDSHAERLENGTYQVLVLMELCPNKSLLEYMNARLKTKLTESEILKILFDICLGVYEMHRLKLIHRDIKIENVLIDARHNFKLCDFGSTTNPIMPPQDQQQFQALSHDILYQTTPQYRSPEMIDLYKGFPIDEKADIWALGCFLYKLCYYTTPFEASGDIAILHASFQFLPQPVYSGDLKNLIIIMLQDNPLFRPNIVQVLMLVTAMMKIDFNELGVADFYKAGPFNFHALHEYQRHKQNELLKQQQLYYQQQALSGSAPPPISSLPQSPSLPTQATANPSIVEGAPHITKENLSQRASASPPPADIGNNLERAESDPTEENETFDDLESFNNVQERYPSLEDLLIDPEGQDHESRSPLQPENFETVEYPTRPKVLSSTALQAMTSEQLAQYNQQHETYRYNMNQYRLHEQERLKQEQLHGIKRQTYAPNSSDAKPKGSADLERTNAWEVHPKRVDKDAERLADDIFSKESPSESHRRKSSEGSRKEDLEVKNLSNDDLLSPIDRKVSAESLHESKTGKTVSDDLEAGIPTSVENQPLTEDVRSSFQNDDVEEPVTSTLYSDTQMITPSNSSKSSRGANPFPIPQKNGITHSNELSTILPSVDYKQKVYQDQRNGGNPWGGYSRQVPMTNSTSMYGQLDQSQLEKRQQLDQRHMDKRQLDQRQQDQRHLDQMQLDQRQLDHRKLDHGKLDHRKLDHRQSDHRHSDQRKNNLQDQLGALRLNDNQGVMESRGFAETDEPNLIDLEVGLDSSASSIATPILKLSHTRDQISYLDSEDSGSELNVETIHPGEPKHHFKKRIPSIQNPSNFKFEEEVIDFASDDENPENSSKMNRLSIRNSLKKQPRDKPKTRKTSDHKKAEATTIENKKRLSLFGGNTSGN